VERDAFVTIFIVTLVASMACGLTIQAVVCWLLSSWVKRIPEEHRKLGPGSVWLLMIPLFSILWNFLVYPRISDSFESYFRSKGDSTSTGRGMSLAYCILALASMPLGIAQMFMNPAFKGQPPAQPSPPLVLMQMGGGCMSVVMLVLWVLILVKFHGLQKRIVAPTPA
jgi:protein-S-isoprenylcysteine O-methyltransferase Ste14